MFKLPTFYADSRRLMAIQSTSETTQTTNFYEKIKRLEEYHDYVTKHNNFYFT